MSFIISRISITGPDSDIGQGRARGYGRITRQNLVFQLPFWGQHFKPQIKKDG